MKKLRTVLAIVVLLGLSSCVHRARWVRRHGGPPVPVKKVVVPKPR